MTSNLILHCGAAKADFVDVEAVVTPAATKTWQPIPHTTLIGEVKQALELNNQLVVAAQAHALSRNGDRYFGLMEVTRQNSGGEDFRWVLGLRNTHDMSFSAGVVAGMSVFVCDNLSFSGEVHLARKHTRHIIQDLPGLVQGLIGDLMAKWNRQDNRVLAYKRAELTDTDAHDLMIRSVDAEVCPNRLLPKVLQEWRHPRHEAFVPRNAWSLFNAYTEALKGGSVFEMPNRTIALHGLIDTHIGLSAEQIAAN